MLKPPDPETPHRFAQQVNVGHHAILHCQRAPSVCKAVPDTYGVARAHNLLPPVRPGEIQRVSKRNDELYACIIKVRSHLAEVELKVTQGLGIRVAWGCYKEGHNGRPGYSDPHTLGRRGRTLGAKRIPDA